MFREPTFTKNLGFGAVDVHAAEAESVAEIKANIRRALEVVPPERLTISPDCGIKLLPREVAYAKLENMVQAAREIEAELDDGTVEATAPARARRTDCTNVLRSGDDRARRNTFPVHRNPLSYDRRDGREIQEMQTHSSSVVAVRATRALGVDRTGVRHRRGVRPRARAQRLGTPAGEPSHASLQNAVRGVVEDVTDADLESVAEAKELTRERIDAVVSRIESAKDRAAENAVAHLEDGATLLTHDYLDGDRGARARDRRGKALRRLRHRGPTRYIGRKTARTLAGMDGVEATLITDSANGFALEV